MKARRQKFFYGYIVVASAFIITAVLWGIHNSFGVFFEPVLTEFGWTRAMTSGAFSLCTFLLGLLGIVGGRLTDKLGPRMVVTTCGLFFGLGYLLISQIGEIWQLYLFYGLVIGIGISGGYVPLVSTVARWFVKRRGLMTGIVMAGTAIGTVIFPPVTRWLISTYDWRTSYIVVGITALIFVTLTAQFLRRDPARMGLTPYGESKVKQESSDLKDIGFSLKEAIHTRQFWMVCIVHFCHYFATLTVLVHVVIYAIGLGISSANAANILAIIGGAGAASRIIMGGVGDRIGNKRGLTIGFILWLVAFLLLILAKKVWMLYLFAILCGIAYGNQHTLLTPMVAELFGLHSLGVIVGIAVFAGTIGGAIGPVLAGGIFDIRSTYQPAFLICAAISVTGAIVTSLLRPVGSEV